MGPAILLALFVRLQASPQTPAGPDALQQHYEAAARSLGDGDQARAATEYSVFLAEALHRAANGEAAAGEFDDATRWYDEALLLAPLNPDLYRDYAGVCFDLDDLPRAKSLAEKSLQLDPRNSDTQLILGRILFHLADYEAAKGHLQLALAANPDFNNGYLLGTTYLLLNDEENARTLFKEMIAGFGDTALLHIYLGRAYSRTDHPNLAIDEFHKAIAKDSQARDAHYYLALAYLGHNEEAGYDRALPELRAELKVNPEDYRSHYMIGYIALRQRNLPEAESELTRAAQLNPDDLNASLSLAQIYSETERYSDAVAKLQTTITAAERKSGNEAVLSRAHYLMGRLLAHLGRAEESRQQMTIVAEMQRKAGSTASIGANERIVNAASLARNENIDLPEKPPGQRGSPEELARLQTFLKALRPAIADAYFNLGAISATQKQFSAATEYFVKASDWDPGIEGLDRSLGLAAYYAGQYERALGPLQRSLAAAPNDSVVRAAGASAYYQLGKLHLGHGENKAAIANLEASVQMNPNNADAHRQLAAAYRNDSRTADAEREMKLYEQMEKHP